MNNEDDKKKKKKKDVKGFFLKNNECMYVQIHT